VLAICPVVFTGDGPGSRVSVEVRGGYTCYCGFDYRCIITGVAGVPRGGFAAWNGRASLLVGSVGGSGGRPWGRGGQAG